MGSGIRIWDDGFRGTRLLDHAGVKIAVVVCAVAIGACIPLLPEACIAVLGLAFICVVINELPLAVLLTVACLGIFTDGFNPNRSVDDVAYRINVAHIYITELLVYGFICIYGLRRLLGIEKRHVRVKGALDRILPIFGLLTFGFMIFGYLETHDAAGAFGYHGGRVLLVSMAFYFLLVNILSDTEDVVRLFKWFFVAATIKATFALVKYLLGMSGSDNDYAGTPVPIYEIEQSFALGVCITAAVAGIVSDVLKKREAIFALFSSSIMLLVIVLSLRRSVWVSLLVSFAVVFFMCPVKHKLRIVVCSALLGLTLVAAVPEVSQRLEQRIGFLAELTERPELISREDGDIQFHFYDIMDAWAAFKETPFGRGFPGGYRRVMTSNRNNQFERYLGAGVVHNEILNLAVKEGIVGVAIYLLMLAGFTRDMLKVQRGVDLRSKAILATCLGSILGAAALGLTSAHLLGNTLYPMVNFTLLALAMVVRSQLLTQRQQDPAVRIGQVIFPSGRSTFPRFIPNV